MKIDIEKTKNDIKRIVREFLLNEDDVEKTKVIFSEFMKTKENWNMFLMTAVPNLDEDAVHMVSEEEFQSFKKILFDEIESYKPKGK